MMRTAVVQIRIDPSMCGRRADLREQFRVDLYAWLRDLVTAAADCKPPLDGEKETAPSKPPATNRQDRRERRRYFLEPAVSRLFENQEPFHTRL